MPGPTNTLLIEGSFEELAEELAQYIDNAKKTPGDDTSSLLSEVSQLLEESQKDEALKKLVTASAILNSAPEKEFIAAYNLLIHLLRQSPNLNIFLPKLCTNLSQPIPSSPLNASGLALSILTSLFNIMSPTNDTRYHVFLAILAVVKRSTSYESMRPQLKKLDRWIAEWESDEEDQYKLFLELADVAEEAGEEEDSYLYLLRALRVSDPAATASPTLAIRALSLALLSPQHYDFADLLDLDAIQGLRTSSPQHYDVLEIFTSKQLDDYDEFLTEHPSFLTEQEPPLDASLLYRKMRLLTLSSLAAAAPARILTYQSIATALQIPTEDVERWCIDVIRAGLVEGKLSQLRQELLVHRATHRLFADRQWQEVASRLATWQESLRAVLGVVRAEREHVEIVKAREAREADSTAKMEGMAAGRRRIIPDRRRVVDAGEVADGVLD